jgi:hypothetical protein
MATKIYLVGTAAGPRLVRAGSIAKARNFVVAGYIGDSRMATADDLARINQEAGGLVIEDVVPVDAAGYQQPAA